MNRPMSTYTFEVASCGTEPRIMDWDHFSREGAQQEMERKGYEIISYIGEE